MRLVIATKNRGKVTEIRSLLGLAVLKNVEVATLADVPNVGEPRETGKTFAENARIKALYYAQQLKSLCVADDSGLAVEALGGMPGVFSARYAGEGATDEQNIAHLLHALSKHPRPWKAAFVCVAMAALPGRVVAQATGSIQGEIVPDRRGQGGFGYDPVFLVTSMGKTMAELPAETKNGISHRGEAMRSLVAEMKNSGLLLG
ncbi:MAG: non-canonical purine pyrophosphatase [Deltaproteobacteria bacterium]|jgi:XTP/dITP diphosphohydrolase|nr:non-canonical purine pyrophosphatase [Deltaproteobacteria bacterium]